MNSPSLGYILQYYYWHRIHIYFQVTMTTLVEHSQAQLTENNILHKILISTLFLFYFLWLKMNKNNTNFWIFQVKFLCKIWYSIKNIESRIFFLKICPIFVHSYAIKPGYNQKSIFLDQIFGHQLSLI